MGVWGAGLYSGDFAMDLRSSIGAVVRLPFDEDRLVDILCETEPAVANNPEDSDHSIFWLVLPPDVSTSSAIDNGCPILNKARDSPRCGARGLALRLLFVIASPPVPYWDAVAEDRIKLPDILAGFPTIEIAATNGRPTAFPRRRCRRLN